MMWLIHICHFFFGHLSQIQHYKPHIRSTHVCYSIRLCCVLAILSTSGIPWKLSGMNFKMKLINIKCSPLRSTICITLQSYEWKEAVTVFPEWMNFFSFIVSTAINCINKVIIYHQRLSDGFFTKTLSSTVTQWSPDWSALTDTCLENKCWCWVTNIVCW